MPDLLTFLYARLDDDARIARAALGERSGGEPEHWHWEGTQYDNHLDPDLAIAGNEEFLDGGGPVSLRSVEEYPTSVGQLPTFVIPHAEEVAPGPARHIATHNPARVLLEVQAKRHILDWADSPSIAEYEKHYILCALAEVYSSHPDYQAEWGM